MKMLSVFTQNPRFIFLQMLVLFVLLPLTGCSVSRLGGITRLESTQHLPNTPESLDDDVLKLQNLRFAGPARLAGFVQRKLAQIPVVNNKLVYQVTNKLGKALPGVLVELKNGEGVLASVWTDAQGVAAFKVKKSWLNRPLFANFKGGNRYERHEDHFQLVSSRSREPEVRVISLKSVMAWLGKMRFGNQK